MFEGEKSHSQKASIVIFEEAVFLINSASEDSFAYIFLTLREEHIKDYLR